jgi:ubiquinone/menaquinone biosynthesis C-methylase UbiE
MGHDDPRQYVLGRHADESRRLDRQHAVFSSAAGYKIHPRIQSILHSQNSVKVLDIATGTGAWLLALEHTAPSGWTLEGSDISADQFPANIDSGCKFSVLDIKKPVPEELRGTFDLVHIRMLLGGLVTPDWALVAANVYQLLKPGGWIQWHEIDAPRMQFFPLAAEASTEHSQALLSTCVRGYQRIDDRFMEQDMELFTERIKSAGFTNCHMHRPSSDRVPDMRQEASLTMHMAVSSALKYLVKADPTCGVTSEEAEGLASRSLEEVQREDIYWRWDMCIVTASKPS